MRVLKWTGGLLLVLFAALLLFVVFGLHTLRGPITRAVSTATGRELVIEGELKPVWSWVHPRFRAGKVSFANPDWASEELMFQAEAVEGSIEILPLLVGRVVVPEVHLVHPVVNLELDEAGRKNWIMDRDQKEKKDSGSRIHIKRLTLDSGQLSYLEPGRGMDIHAELSTDRSGVAFDAKGKYKDMAAHAQGHGGQVLGLKDSGTPFPIDATGKIGDTTFKLKGTVTNMVQLSAFDLAIDVQGKTMADLYDVIGIAFPETSDYRTQGRLVRGDHRVRYEKFTAAVGKSDLAGTLQFDTGGKRAFMQGELSARTLELGDLGAVVGTNQPRKSGVLPDMPFDAERWASVDADVRIKAGSIERPKQLPLEHLVTRIQMRDKVLTLDPFEFGMAGGKVAGTVKMDGQKDPIAGSTRLRVKDLELPKLFPTIKEGQASMGDINGLIELDGTGASVGQMLGSANGKVGLFLDGGKISRFMMELAALDIWGVARVKLKGDQPVEIRCAIADFAVKDGLMRTNAFVFDTEIVNINGAGTVNLKTEALDLTLKPEPKDRSIASLNSPLYIRGTFGAPKVSADYKRMTVKGVGALVMGVLNPLLAVLPLMQEGKGKDSPCAQLIAHATDPKARSKPPVDPSGAGASAAPKRREGQKLPKTD